MSATDVVVPNLGGAVRTVALTRPPVDAPVLGVQGVLVPFAGDLDIASSPVLAACLGVLARRRVGAVTLDVSGVTFMDCAGLGVVLRAQARLHGYLWLRAPSPPVRRLLDLLRLGGHLTSVPDPAAVPSLRDRSSTEQVTGMVMGTYGCTAEQASRRLADSARSSHLDPGVLVGLLVTVGTELLAAPAVTLDLARDGKTVTTDLAADVVRVMEPSSAELCEVT